MEGIEREPRREIIGVELPQREYAIVVGSGLVEEVARHIALARSGGNVVLVTQPPVARAHAPQLNRLEKLLGDEGFLFHRIAFPSGERYKNLNTVRKIYQKLLELGVERRDMLIAWGGGVVGDVAGFVAASYLRGVDYLQVPTTLMAMVDSSIGGKVGVNLGEGKNLAGFFYQPRGVFCDVDLLTTLPRRELVSGMAEVAKYALVFQASLYSFLLREGDRLATGEETSMIRVISKCAGIKARMVEEDELDLKDWRILLNYGHTLGHALEKVTAYRELLHGEAVALGMRVAAKVSAGMGLAGEELYRQHLDLLEGLGLVGIWPSTCPPREVMEALRYDKKRARGRLRMVLLRKVARPAIVDDPPESLISQSLREVLKEERR